MSIKAEWLALSKHATECAICAEPVEVLRQVPEDPRRTDYEAYEAMCPAGREAFTAWRDAKNAWLEGTLGLRRRQFVTDDQVADDLTDFETRAAAIMSIPGPGFGGWLALPDQERRAQLRALEAARRRSLQARDRQAQVVPIEDARRRPAWKRRADLEDTEP